jgi:hypothetical protein
MPRQGRQGHQLPGGPALGHLAGLPGPLGEDHHGLAGGTSTPGLWPLAYSAATRRR